MKCEKGSALITVILIILIITTVGLAGMLFMNIENTISGNDRYQKEALYLAEVGLKAGEAKIAQIGVSQITGLLQYSNANNDIPPSLDDCTGVDYLGTVLTDTSANPLYNIPVHYNTGASGSGDRTGYYSVYVRNNKRDSAGSPTIDADGYIDIISVGMVKDSSGNVKFQKILSEEFYQGKATSGKGGQIGGSTANTNTQEF